MQKICYGILIIFSTALLSGLFLNSYTHAGTATVETTVQITVCGNNIQETGEECDGTDLVGQNCTTKGFTGGTLSCSPACDFDTSSCTTGGGGGGGGGGIVSPVETTVVFIGRAYPNSTVTILKDAQIVLTVNVGSDTNFSASITDVSSGIFIFSVYGEDNQGRRSSLLTFPVSITTGTTTTIRGIFIAPTIDVDKSEVRRGENIAIFGQSVPLADIVISVNSHEEFFARTISDSDGIYLHNFDTSLLEFGEHYTKAKASIGNELISNFSRVINFKVGTKNVVRERLGFLKGDLNDDGRVNIVDFSIAAFWYKRVLSVSFQTIETERLNGDGKVDLVDFSIMAFYWSG